MCLMTHLLSKSKYIRGLQCVRALWLDVHEPRLARYTAEQMRRFDYGREFEWAFKSLFPDAIDVSAELRRQVDAYPELTRTLLERNEGVTLFEAGFQYDDVLVLADVVSQREDGSVDVYEVKSGGTLSDTYRRDAALQHYVVSHCCKVHSFSVVYNGTAAADGVGEERFAVVDLTGELAAEGDAVAARVAAMKPVVLATDEPDVATGRHCNEPYACPYMAHCQGGARQLALF